MQRFAFAETIQVAHHYVAHRPSNPNAPDSLVSSMKPVQTNNLPETTTTTMTTTDSLGVVGLPKTYPSATVSSDDDPQQQPQPQQQQDPPYLASFTLSQHRWNVMFLHLCEYKVKYGHCDVPQKYAFHPQLGKWVHHQRSAFAKGTLNDYRKQRLMDIGFSQHVLTGNREALWKIKFDQLVQYKKEHGHCMVPNNYKKNRALGKWVQQQRMTKLMNAPSYSDRERRLTEIGFMWDEPTQDGKVSLEREKVWEDMLNRLVQYKKEHEGLCTVPSRYAKDPALASWVIAQRLAKKRGTLSEEHERCLTEIGFSWSAETKTTLHERLWNIMFDRLAEYKKKHGDCMVPTKYEKDPKLGAWVLYQRRARTKGTLSDGRQRRLNEIGFTWYAHEANCSITWNAMFDRLVEYKNTQSERGLAISFIEDPTLGSWLGRQRKLMIEGTLSDARKRRLIDIGVALGFEEAKPKL